MTKRATREAYGKALAELGEKHEDIVVLDADLSGSTKTAKFGEKFPERFFNAGIAEGNMMGVAAGLATTGKVVFASTFAVFASQRACEQVRNSICYPNLNVKIGATHAGITVGADGGSHQAIEDVAIMSSMPNMTVVVPGDGVSTEALIKQAYEYEGPVYIRMSRAKVEDVYPEDTFFSIGQSNMLKDGEDATIIVSGYLLNSSIQAAKILEEQGINVRLIDMSTIKPLDVGSVLKAAKETKAIVTVEEHNVIGGLGSAVASFLAENYPTPIQMVGLRDVFGQSGEAKELLEEYNLTPNDIVNAVKEVLSRK
jgi:transketolase